MKIIKKLIFWNPILQIALLTLLAIFLGFSHKFLGENHYSPVTQVVGLTVFAAGLYAYGWFTVIINTLISLYILIERKVSPKKFIFIGTTITLFSILYFGKSLFVESFQDYFFKSVQNNANISFSYFSNMQFFDSPNQILLQGRRQLLRDCISTTNSTDQSFSLIADIRDGKLLSFQLINQNQFTPKKDSFECIQAVLEEIPFQKESGKLEIDF